MLFSNPQILRTNEDIKIGGIKISSDMMSYNQYKTAVRIRLTKLVQDFVKNDMSEGATQSQSIDYCLSMIHESLNYVADEQFYPNTIDGLVEEIMRSEEFQNWITEIRYRFFATHESVVDANKPVEAVGHMNPAIDPEIAQMVEESDTLEYFIDALVAENYYD